MIVTNSTVFSCPWADAMFAIDKPWWDAYGDRVERDFVGMRFSGTRRHGSERPKLDFIQNTGASALLIAANEGARRIVMVGFDCAHTGGRKHHHADHPRPLGNAGSVKRWPAMFALAAAQLRRLGVECINASRATALQCFPRADLEELI